MCYCLICQGWTIQVSQLFHIDVILKPWAISCWVDKQVFAIRIKVHLGFSTWAFAFRLYCRTRKVLRLSRKTLSRVKNENWTFYSTSRMCTSSQCKRKRKRYKYFNWSGLNVRHQLKYSRKCSVIITYTSSSNSKKFHNHEDS